MTTSQFRYLLIASLVFGLAAAFFDMAFPFAVPQDISQAQAAYDEKISTSTPMLIIVTIGLIGAVGFVAAFIGLFQFRPWAPRIAVLSTALLILILPGLGVDVSSGWASALNEISSTSWGVALALVYFSPLKEQFIVTRLEQSAIANEVPLTKELAHPGKRFQGQFIDGLVAYLLGFVSFYLLDMFIGRELAVYSGLAVGVTYFLLSDALPNGQSIGKKILNMRVVNKKTKESCSLFQSFLRNVTFPLGLFDWMFIFFGSHRRLGDFIASTIVIKNDRKRADELG